MSQDWDIKPRADACSACSEPFTDGQVYFSALISGGEEGIRRSDMCSACWPQNQAEAVVLSSWQGTFKLPPPPPEEALKKETAEGMLRKLMEDEENTRVNVIYILAVMLERKRIFVERDIQHRDDGSTIRIYEHRQTGETFLIPEPHLRLDQLEEVQAEVVEMLGGKPKTQTPEPQQEDRQPQAHA